RLPSIDFTGSTNSPTFAASTFGSQIYGSMTLISGMTLSGSADITLSGRGSLSITSAGKSFGGRITVDAGTGVFTCQDAFSSAGLTLTSGGFDANDFAVSQSAACDTAGSATR